tara:strand:+ start:351 stop:1034 length:684 start_codon:yes stop_codon:yes gene_type:complete
MDAVFKQYGVCEDVSDMIAKKVHEGHQKKINDHISVIIGWDPRFDYWTIGNFKSKSLFWPYHEPYGLERASRVVLSGLRDRYYNVFKKELRKKNMKPALTKEEYMSYVLCGKKVFMMHRPVRWNRFIDGLDNKYQYRGQLERPVHVRPLSVYLSRTTLLMNRQYNESNQERVKLLSSSPDYDPVRSFIHKKTLLKKDLISWLNKNGDPRKLTNKKKKELWIMIMKLE